MKQSTAVAWGRRRPAARGARRTPETLPGAVAVIAMLAAGPLGAQEPSARAYLEPAEVEVGDSFQVVIEVTGAGEVENPKALSYSLGLLRGSPFPPGQALPFATRFTAPPGGQAGGSVIFSYSRVAEMPGSFDLGPFEVKADGRKLQTGPVTLVVTLPDPGAVSVRARLDRTEVAVNDEFELVVEVTPPDIVLPWPDLSDLWDFASENLSERGDGSMTVRLVATAPGTHQIGPLVFDLAEGTLETEPVTLVVAGDQPSLEARMSINTGQTWVGTDFLLVVEAGARELDADPVLPDMSAFAGPPRAGGEGRSFNRGRYTVSRTYRVRAAAAGEFEIGPAQVTANGRTVLTEPLRLVISEARPAAPVESPRDLRVTAVADRQRAYVGEPVTVTYRVLARDNRRGGFEGWWAENPDTLVLHRHEYFRTRRLGWRGGGRERISEEGRLYRVVSEQRVVFAAKEAGETAVGSAEVRVQVQPRDGDMLAMINMNEAEREGTWTPVILTAGPIPVEVLPLPVEGRPGSFRGHVGRLRAATRIDRTHMAVGDTLTLRVEVSSAGSGMVAPVPVPEIAFPAGFDVLEPEVDDAPTVGEGFSVAHFHSYRLVARQAGRYRIPAVEVSWFDPESQSYGTSVAEPFDIVVAGGARQEGGLGK